MAKSKLMEMNNVGIVVESLDNAISFFTETGLKLQGRAMVEGEWAGRVTGLGNQSVEVAMMVTPDGHSRLELSGISHSSYYCRPQDCSSELSWLSPYHV